MRAWFLAVVAVLLAGGLFWLVREGLPAGTPAGGAGSAIEAVEPGRGATAGPTGPTESAVQSPDSAPVSADERSPARTARSEVESGLSVRTQLAATGEPVPQVGVRALRPVGPVPAHPSELIDGFDGPQPEIASERFELTDDAGALTLALEPGTWVVRAEALAVVTEAQVVEVAGGEVQDLVLRLPSDPWSWFHARVVSAESGRPLGTAEYARRSFQDLQPRGPQAGASARSFASVGFRPVEADGTFRERMLATVPWFEVRAPGRTPLRFVAPSTPTSSVAPHVVELEEARSVVFVARAPAGTPVAGIELEVRIPQAALWRGANAIVASAGDFVRTAVSDAEGRAVFVDLPQRPAPVTNVTGGDRRRVLEVVDLSKPRSEYDVLVGVGTRVAGRVVDETGSALPAFALRLVQVTDSRTRGPADEIAAVTDSDGRFEIADVHAGAWRLVPRATELEKQSREVRVATAPVDVTWELWRAVRLFGRVLDANGAAAADVDVIAQRVGLGGIYQARTDAAGRFELGPLGPGDLRLLARRVRSGYGAESSDPIDVTPAPGMDAVELRLGAR